MKAVERTRQVPASDEKPNVVLIMTDDQGWWHLGIHGNSLIETPTMDRLAREGVRLTNFYGSPVCTPSRACLLTGRHYQRTGALDHVLDRDPLRTEEVTVAEIFHDHGYRTALIGKWHLGRYMKYHPMNRGFSEFFGFWQYGFINHYFDSDELFHNRNAITTTGYVTDVLTDQAIEFIRLNSHRPFFLYLPYNAPHLPHLVPDAYIKKYLSKGLPFEVARLYGMITSLDDNLARLLKAIDDQGIRKRTIIIYTSDHGGIDTYFRAGLRGGKGSVYEGGVRVPFIARWPGRFSENTVVESEAQHIDILPTLCELAGIALPIQLALDGKSITSLLITGHGASPHRYVYHQWHRISGPRAGVERRAILDIQTGYKLVTVHPEDLNLDFDQLEREPVNSSAQWELFDLRSDPGEKQDLSRKHPEIVVKLQRRYEDWYVHVSRSQDSRMVPIEVGRRDENPVDISLLWAEPVGKELQFTFRHYAGDSFDHWSNVKDCLRWNIDVIEEGLYDVMLEYGCHIKDAGSRVAVTACGSRLEHVVQTTGGGTIYRRFAIGSLLLKRGSTPLEIAPISIVGRELMCLHGVCLNRKGSL